MIKEVRGMGKYDDYIKVRLNIAIVEFIKMFL